MSARLRARSPVNSRGGIPSAKILLKVRAEAGTSSRLIPPSVNLKCVRERNPCPARLLERRSAQPVPLALTPLILYMPMCQKMLPAEFVTLLLAEASNMGG